MKRYSAHRLQVLLSSILAVGAIALATWEGLENRRHNRLSVAPRLDGSANISRESAALGIQSNGLGPAVITSFRIYLDDKIAFDAAADDSATSPWQRIAPLLNLEHHTISGYAFGRGSLLRAGQDYELFSVMAKDSANAPEDYLATVINRLAVEVGYCSMYQDQCDTTYVGIRPRAAQSLSAPRGRTTESTVEVN